MIEYFTTIGEIATVYDGPHATPKKTEKGPYFLSISSLEKGRLDLSKSAHLGEVDFVRWTKRVTPQEGDLLFSYETRLGEAALMPGGVDACLGRRMGLLRPHKNKVISEYLLYAYLSPYFQQIILRNTVTGATVNRISLNEMPNFPIRIPPIPEQRLIAKLLSAIDKKIALNNKINTELEAIAKLIYDYWFVQFDFPDANGKPYKSSGGKMVYNEDLKREIPEGWLDVQFGDYNAVKKGELITKKTVKAGTIKVVAAGLNYSYFHSTPNYDKNTITISGSGASAGFVNFWREPIFASDCITVRGASDADTLLALHYLKLMQEHIFKQARGSAQPHVYPNDISKLKYLIPPKSLIEAYGKIVLRANDKISINIKENELLTELRDWLLPLLMNGQVTVKDI